MSNFDYNTYLLNRSLCSKYYNLIPGPIGIMGPQGAIGPKGVQGATGSQGAQGAQGACCVGAQGLTGSQGAQGSGAGVAGPEGPRGAPGQGFTINNFVEDVLTLTNDFSNPAYSFAFPTLPGAGATWHVAWSISVPNFSDNTNNFFITFSDGLVDYEPIIHNKTFPYFLSTNGTHLAGTGNDIITLGSSTDYVLNIYHSSNLNSGREISFKISITLISL